MLKFNQYESFFQPFFFNETFKTEEVYKQIAAVQQSLYGQVEKYSKIIQEENKKAVEFIQGQLKGFDKNALISQMEKILQVAEENNQKAKKYFEENAKLVDKEVLVEQFKQFLKIVEENQSKVIKQIEKTNMFVSKEVMADQVEKFVKMTEENQEKAVKYFDEQYQYWVKFQEDLLAGMKSEDSAKVVPNAIKTYSKAVVNSNMKKLDENIQAVKEVVNK